MSIKIGDLYYLTTLRTVGIVGNILPKNRKFPYRFDFLINNEFVKSDYPCEESELHNKVLLNNPINKLLYPEYVEKGDFLYEKNITNANFTLDDYYKLRNAYNERQSWGLYF